MNISPYKRNFYCKHQLYHQYWEVYPISLNHEELKMLGWQRWPCWGWSLWLAQLGRVIRISAGCNASDTYTDTWQKSPACTEHICFDFSLRLFPRTFYLRIKNILSRVHFIQYSQYRATLSAKMRFLWAWILRHFWQWERHLDFVLLQEVQLLECSIPSLDLSGEGRMVARPHFQCFIKVYDFVRDNLK